MAEREAEYVRTGGMFMPLQRRDRKRPPRPDVWVFCTRCGEPYRKHGYCRKCFGGEG